MQRQILTHGAALVFGLAGLAALEPGRAAAADVSLDNVTVKTDKTDHTVVLKHVDAKGSSLSADDLQKWISGQLTHEQDAATAKAFKADSVTITEIDTSDPKTTVAIKNVVATGVDSGKIAKLDIASADFKGDESSGHMGAVHAETLNFAPFLDNPDNPHFSGLGLTAFTFEGLDMMAPLEEMPKDAPGGRLMHVVVSPISFTASYDGTFPVKGEGTIKGVSVELPPNSENAAQMKAFGLDKVQFDVHVASTCDKAAKTCKLSDFTINVDKLASLTVTGNVANVPTAIDPADKDATMAAFMAEQIADLQVKLVDAGLYDKAVAFAAATKHASPAVMKASLPAMAMMVPQFVGDPVAGKKLAEALSTFLQKPKSLQVSVKANGAPVAISALVAEPDPSAIFKKLTLDAVANQ